MPRNRIEDKRLISQYRYLNRKGKLVIVPSHTRTYYKKQRKVPHMRGSSHNIRRDFEVTKSVTRRKYNIVISDRDSLDEAAHLEAELSFGGEDMYIKELEVEEKYRGRGLFPYMIKDLTNYADKKGITLRLKSQPFGEYYDPEIKDYRKTVSTQKGVARLSNYYKRFGFKPTQDIQKDMNDRWAQYMIRNP